MCNTRKDTQAADPGRSNLSQRTPRRSSSASAAVTLPPSSSAVLSTASTSFPTHSNAGRPPTGFSSSNPSSSSTSSGHLSIASLREFLPESPHLYDFSEICSATNNFLGKRLSSSKSNSWRCTLRGKDVVVFQRRFRGEPAALRRRLAASSKIHHSSIVRLLGAALAGDYIYLVYEYVHGASLAECLRNPHNAAFTPLATWVDRMQVAADVAQGLQYIHHFTTTGMSATPSKPHNLESDAHRGISRRRPVHNRLKSSSVVITEPQLRAKICHFAAAELAGEICVSSDSEDDQTEGKVGAKDEEIYENPEDPTALPSKLGRSGSRKLRFEGTRGYIAPEIRDGGSPSQKSDVYAFGVVLLELLTGEEPVKYMYKKETEAFEMVSLIGTAMEAMGTEEEAEEDGEGEAEAPAEGVALAEERHWRLRRWMDRRLKDSFPVEVAERAARLALECVRAEAERRPDMVRVAGKLSRLLLQSKAWAEKLGVPAEFTVSMAPR